MRNSVVLPTWGKPMMPVCMDLEFPLAMLGQVTDSCRKPPVTAHEFATIQSLNFSTSVPRAAFDDAAAAFEAYQNISFVLCLSACHDRPYSTFEPGIRSCRSLAASLRAR